MNKQDKMCRIFMSIMIFIVAGLLLACGIIAVQKNLKINININVLPKYTFELFVKNNNTSEADLLFRNFSLTAITSVPDAEVYLNQDMINLDGSSILLENNFFAKYDYNFTCIIKAYANYLNKITPPSELRVNALASFEENDTETSPTVTPELQYKNSLVPVLDKDNNWAYYYYKEYEFSCDFSACSQSQSKKLNISLGEAPDDHFGAAKMTNDETQSILYLSSGKKDNYTWNAAVAVLEGFSLNYYDPISTLRKTETLKSFIPDSLSTSNFDVESIRLYDSDQQNSGINSIDILVGEYDNQGNITSSGKARFILGKDGKLYMLFPTNTTFYEPNSSGVMISYKCTFKVIDGLGNTTYFPYSWTITEEETDANKIYDYSTFTSSSSLGTLKTLEAACITPDTLITLADGSQKRVDQLTGNEQLLVWNMRTGKFDSAPIMFIDSDPEYEFNIIKLTFSDNTEVNVIYEHGFWDYDLNKYVYFLEDNCFDYIGHTFAKQNGDELEQVELINVEIEKILTTAWSPITVEHLGYFVNGMLSMPGGTNSFVNMFEFDTENMIYDFEKMEEDIATYGLFTYEELNEICPLPEELFYGAGAQYLKVSIAKGLMTLDELIYKINIFRDYV